MKLIFEELKMSTKHIIWFSCYINDKTKVGAFPGHCDISRGPVDISIANTPVVAGCWAWCPWPAVTTRPA